MHQNNELDQDERLPVQFIPIQVNAARTGSPDTRSRLPLIPLILIGWPILEIAGFVVVGGKIGVLWTIALVLLASVAGSILLRIQGFGAMNRIRRDLDAGRNPGRELAHGFMIMFAGILLLIPGFVSDVVGLLLFIPPVRDLAWNFLKRRITVIDSFGPLGGFRSDRRDERTIDLDAEDFSRRPNPGSPWRIDRDR